jgi:hypothetical protein
MWTIVVLALAVIVVVLAVSRMKKRKDPPVDTYVCDICGQKHCDCRKKGP